jgi:hypothetical protein
MRVIGLLCVVLGCGGDSPDPRGKLYGLVLISVAGGGEVTGTIGNPIDCTATTTGTCKGDNSSHAGSVTANDRTVDGVDWIFSTWAPFRSDAITNSTCAPDSKDLSQRTITLSALGTGQDCLAVFREAQLTDVPIIQIVMPETGKEGDQVSLFGNFPGVKPSPTPEPSPAQVALVMFTPGVLAEVTSASSTQIDTTVPKGAMTGPISLFVPSGKATSPHDFTVVPMMMMMGGGQCGYLTDVKFDPATAHCGSGAGEAVTLPLALTATIHNAGAQPLTVTGATVTVDLAQSCHVSGIGSWMVGTGSAIPPGQDGTFTLTSTSTCQWPMGVMGDCEIVADVTTMTNCGTLFVDSTMSNEGLVISVP